MRVRSVPGAYALLGESSGEALSLLERHASLLRGKVVVILQLSSWQAGSVTNSQVLSVPQLEGASDLIDKALLAGEGTLGAWAPRVGRDGGWRLDGKATLKAQSLGVPHFLLPWFRSSQVTPA